MYSILSILGRLVVVSKGAPYYANRRWKDNPSTATIIASPAVSFID